MREERRNYLAVGSFVVAVCVGLLVWLAVLSGRTGATDPYHVVYDEVMGIAAGTEVLHQGYSIGIVRDIRPQTSEGRRRFRVNLAVERGWSIPEDSEAVITSPGFLSSAVIDVRGGTSPTPLAAGSEIRAGSAADLAGAVSAAATRVSRMMESRVEPLLESLAEGTPEILANLRDFSVELNETGDGLAAVLGPENRRRVDAILSNLESASTELSRIGRDLGPTREQLDRLLARANALLDENGGELDHAIRDLHASLESIATRSDAIVQDLEITSRNLAEFSHQIRVNPSLLLRGRGKVPEPD